MAKTMWFRRTIGLGDSIVVSIPADVVKRWKLEVGEQVVWQIENNGVRCKPLRMLAGEVREKEEKKRSWKEREERSNEI